MRVRSQTTEDRVTRHLAVSTRQEITQEFRSQNPVSRRQIHKEYSFFPAPDSWLLSPVSLNLNSLNDLCNGLMTSPSERINDGENH
jgi:hypothetical protein